MEKIWIKFKITEATRQGLVRLQGARQMRGEGRMNLQEIAGEVFTSAVENSLKAEGAALSFGQE